MPVTELDTLKPTSDNFQSFLNEHMGIVTKVCRVYTESQEDFHDFFQEVSLQLWKSWESFRGESKRSTWVYRVALNVCLLQLRFKKRSPSYYSLEPLDNQLSAPTEDHQTEKDIQRLYRAIRQLKDGDRAVVLLYLEDKSYKEMAEILGITVSNVGVKVSRVKAKLKELLGEEIE